MRTNIDLDENLVDQAKLYSETTTKKDLVHEALTTYVAVNKEKASLASYREEVKKIQEQTKRIKLDIDTRDLIRMDRDRV
jgi:Arc/MetJ family transcription regulator